MAQNCAHPTVFGCRGEYLGALTGGGSSLRRTRLRLRVPCFRGKYREISGFRGNNGDAARAFANKFKAFAGNSLKYGTGNFASETGNFT
jgi:hypothetical protein